MGKEINQDVSIMGAKSKNKDDRKKKIKIGRFDRADFPLLKLKNIPIKVDTGAYTSSLHCSYIKVDDDGFLKFKVLDPDHPKYRGKVIKTENYYTKMVKSSNGETEMRFVVETEIKLFEERFPIDLSLTNRGDMKYPVLIGRKLLSYNFKVDTSKINLSYKMKKKKEK